MITEFTFPPLHEKLFSPPILQIFCETFIPSLNKRAHLGMLLRVAQLKILMDPNF